MIGPALLRKMIPFPFKFGESGTPILAPIIKEILHVQDEQTAAGIRFFGRRAPPLSGRGPGASVVQSDSAQGLHLELNGTLHGNKTVLTLDTGCAARRGLADHRRIDRRILIRAGD